MLCSLGSQCRATYGPQYPPDISSADQDTLRDSPGLPVPPRPDQYAADLCVDPCGFTNLRPVWSRHPHLDRALWIGSFNFLPCIARTAGWLVASHGWRGMAVRYLAALYSHPADFLTVFIGLFNRPRLQRRLYKRTDYRTHFRYCSMYSYAAIAYVYLDCKSRCRSRSTDLTVTIHHLGYERVYLPLCKVADTPFHIQVFTVTAIQTNRLLNTFPVLFTTFAVCRPESLYIVKV